MTLRQIYIQFAAVAGALSLAALLPHMLQNMLLARRRFPDRSADEVRQIPISHVIALLPLFYALAVVVFNWLIAYVPTLLTRPKR